jgi:hypothetical protein
MLPPPVGFPVFTPVHEAGIRRQQQSILADGALTLRVNTAGRSTTLCGLPPATKAVTNLFFTCGAEGVYVDASVGAVLDAVDELVLDGAVREPDRDQLRELVILKGAGDAAAPTAPCCPGSPPARRHPLRPSASTCRHPVGEQHLLNQ